MNGQSRRTGRKVLSLTKKKGKKGIYVLAYEGGELLIDEDTLTDFYLYEGKVLSDEELSDIAFSASLSKVRKKAISTISRRFCGENELKEKLLKVDGATPEMVEKVIEELKNARLIDDVRYVDEALEEALIKRIGPRRLLHELRLKKLPEELIEKIVYPNEEEVAKEYLETLLPRLEDLPLNKKKEKAYQALERRGFDRDIILSLLPSLIEDEVKVRESLRKEADSLKAKLSRKYNGRELRNALVSHLLRKGYSYQDIEEELRRNA